MVSGKAAIGNSIYVSWPHNKARKMHAAPETTDTILQDSQSAVSIF